MECHLFFTFVAVSAGLILIPGPNVLLIVSNSVKHGPRRGLATVAGTSSAMIIQLSIVALGTASAMIALSEWFEWLRWCGVTYLIYLGVQQWRFASVEDSESGAEAPSAEGVYWQGFFVSLTNPKTILFFAAFLPQFVDPLQPATPQVAILSATFLALATLLDSSFALLAGRVRGKLANPGRVQFRNRLSGSLLISAGIGLALTRRN